MYESFFVDGTNIRMRQTSTATLNHFSFFSRHSEDFLEFPSNPMINVVKRLPVLLHRRVRFVWLRQRPVTFRVGTIYGFILYLFRKQTLQFFLKGRIIGEGLKKEWKIKIGLPHFVFLPNVSNFEGNLSSFFNLFKWVLFETLKKLRVSFFFLFFFC